MLPLPIYFVFLDGQRVLSAVYILFFLDGQRVLSAGAGAGHVIYTPHFLCFQMGWGFYQLGSCLFPQTCHLYPAFFVFADGQRVLSVGARPVASDTSHIVCIYLAFRWAEGFIGWGQACRLDMSPIPRTFCVFRWAEGFIGWGQACRLRHVTYSLNVLCFFQMGWGFYRLGLDLSPQTRHI